jgi:hypothetical protein
VVWYVARFGELMDLHVIASHCSKAQPILVTDWLELKDDVGDSNYRQLKEFVR